MTIPLVVTAHVEGQGDITVSGAQQFVGTKHQSRRVEGFSINPPSIPGLELEYMAHIEVQGDTQWHRNGHFVGTRGHSRRMEGFAVRLTGYAAGNYDVKYYAHIEGNGDTPVQANGHYCGTRHQSKRLEGLAVWLEPKSHASFGVNVGGSSFGIGVGPYGVSVNVGNQTYSTPTPQYVSQPAYTTAPAYVAQPAYTPTVVYPAQPAFVAPIYPSPIHHAPPPTPTVTAWVHGLGPISTCGQNLAGTRSQSRHLQAFTISGADVEYMAHISGKGDTHWNRAGYQIGHHGGPQIEGFAVRLTGHHHSQYDVKYFAHIAGQGDSSIHSNGQYCGTKGQSRALEGISVWLEPKRY